MLRCYQCSDLEKTLGGQIMRLGMFMQPVHDVNRDQTQVIEEDRETILLADKLGFHEVWVGEHASATVEPITAPLVFLATLLGETKSIKLGTGVFCLPNHHPAQVAAQAALFDHLSRGRFQMGIGTGSLSSDVELFEVGGDTDRNDMVRESMELIQSIWDGEPPYSIEGKYWNITTENTMNLEMGQGIIGKPYQKPHPPIIGTVVAPYSKGIVGLGERGWYAISANFLQPKWVATHWPLFAEGCAKAGRKADTQDWRVAKSIFVADDDRIAQEYGKGEQSPYRFYFKQLGGKLRKAGMLGLFKTDRDQPDEEITLDYMLDSLVITGSINSVVDKLLKFREEIGDFGTLVYNGPDWVDPVLGKGQWS